MKPNTLHQTAAQWHEGQNSALYAYCSTGTVLPGLAAEVKACLYLSKGKEYAELAHLYVTIAPVPAINELEGKRFWHRSLTDSRRRPGRMSYDIDARLGWSGLLCFVFIIWRQQ